MVWQRRGSLATHFWGIKNREKGTAAKLANTTDGRFRVSRQRNFSGVFGMIVLDSTQQLDMTVSSGSSVVAVANFVDMPSTPCYQTQASNSSTPVAIVPSPTAGVTRLVQHIDIFNGDSNAQVVSIFFTSTQLVRQTIPAGYSMQYTTNGGWSAPMGTSTNYYFPGGW